MRTRAAVVLLGLLPVLLAAPGNPWAVVPEWDRGSYRYAAVDVEVAEVLRDFARNQRVGIDLADGVSWSPANLHHRPAMKTS